METRSGRFRGSLAIVDVKMGMSLRFRQGTPWCLELQWDCEDATSKEKRHLSGQLLDDPSPQMEADRHWFVRPD